MSKLDYKRKTIEINEEYWEFLTYIGKKKGYTTFKYYLESILNNIVKQEDKLFQEFKNFKEIERDVKGIEKDLEKKINKE